MALQAVFIMALIGVVNRFGHPMRAAAVFAGMTAVVGGFAMFGGVPLTAVVIKTALSFVAAAVVFWLIDYVEGMFLGVVVTIAGATALVVVSWLA